MSTARIDLAHDELIPVPKLVEQQFGKRMSPPTLWRWRVHGLHGVKLECYWFGGRWCSTPAALEEFVRMSSEAAIAKSATPPEPPTERDPATTRRLQAAGLLS